MSVRWSFHDAATTDLVEATQWYDDENASLGEDFAEAISAMVTRLR